MNLELSQLEKNILNIRLKLYFVQCTFGFGSKEADYIEIVAGECIEDLRKSSHEKTFERCYKKFEMAVEHIGYKQYI